MHLYGKTHACVFTAHCCVLVRFLLLLCLSVRLSVSFVYCIQTAGDNIKLLSRPGTPIILVFVPKRQCPIPRKPLQWGHKIHMVWKICDFRLKSPFSWKWYDIGPCMLCYGTLIGSHRRLMSVTMTLSDP